MTIGSATTTGLSNQLSREIQTKRPEGKKIDSVRSDVPDFQDLMQDSNIAFKEEMEKKKSTMGENGELRVGESKDDKAFREMLERVTGTPQRKTKNSLEKEDFLNLMVTQLKYQDPTKPADHQDMAAQLAQFNTVEQLVSANKSLDYMSKSQDELKSDKLTDYIGKEITATGNKIKIEGEKALSRGSFKLPTDAASVTITIKNSQNETIKNLTLGNTNSGEHEISWDGTNSAGKKVTSGEYNFEISASTTEGKKMEVEKQMTTSVTGISQLAKGGQLETAVGEIRAKEILAVRLPGTGQKDQESNKSKPAEASKPITSAPQNVTSGVAGTDAPAPVVAQNVPKKVIAPITQPSSPIHPLTQPLNKQKQI